MLKPRIFQSFACLLCFTISCSNLLAAPQEQQPKRGTSTATESGGIKIVGTTVTPHQVSTEMQWRRPPDPTLSARVELFVHNDSNQPLRVTGPIRMDERVPKELVDEGTWAWRDPSWEDGFELAPQSLRVLRWNGAKDSWGVNTEHRIDWRIGPVASEPSNTPTNSIPFALRGPDLWIESIVFHSPKQAPHASYPAQVSITIRNQKSKRLQLKSCRMWLPKDNDSFTLLFPRFTFDDIKTWSGDREIAANDLTGFTLEEPSLLPRTYTAIEVELIEEDSSESIRVWGYLKIRPAEFDISGGWISSSVKSKPSMANEDYLKTLSLLHVNTGQIEEAPGYSDNKEFSSKYLFKKFNRLGNRERYDSDEMLPSIHAVEFLGEPQYGGGRPVPPQEVFDKLAPYAAWKLPTSVTLSEERTWRYYAGLSDYPHYDAYRVIAPAADAWNKYQRWGGNTSIRWGAPLETIGSMTRSLRELNRPATIAYWSQGAHDGWGGIMSPRRGSPTGDELRAQAWHGLGNGIASLYWFNLSMKSLAKFPDLLEPIARVGTEIELLRSILETGTAYRYERILTDDKPSWDLSSIVCDDAALFVVNDLDYRIDDKTRTFEFLTRTGQWSFQLPPWLRVAQHCFRVDADGVHEVTYRIADGKVTIEDKVQVVGVYVVTRDAKYREILTKKLEAIQQRATELGFDPIHDPEALAKLKAWVD